MKELTAALCPALLFCMLLPPIPISAEETDAPPDGWNVKIAVPDGAAAVMEDNEYYIYAQEEGSIPYVMLRVYPYDSETELISDFTDYMHEQYSDLEITSDAFPKTVGGKDCYEIDYAYTVSGYTVKDRRLVVTAGEQTYMFASKEIESDGMTVGSMLEDIVAACEFLTDDGTEPQTELEDGYLYCLENRMPKYWLDFSGVLSESPVLHGYFSSDGRLYRERSFVLDLASAESTRDGLVIRQIRDMDGTDISGHFSRLTLQFYLDGALMDIDRKDAVPDGKAEDNILTGTYAMRPVGIAADSSGAENIHFRPTREGPYTAEELGAWAQIFYFRNTGFFPPGSEVTENSDGTFTIRLTGITDADGADQPVSYTVDAFGGGTDDLAGLQIALTD